ncbi:hypothetical protein GCM10009634_61570 [Saccharothrix xinjiangensis]
MSSTPASSGGRPATVAPKATSERPVRSARTSAQQTWSTVLVVSPWSRARAARPAATPGSGVKPSCRGGADARVASGSATSVGSAKPAKARAHAAFAAAVSREASHRE